MEESSPPKPSRFSANKTSSRYLTTLKGAQSLSDCIAPSSLSWLPYAKVILYSGCDCCKRARLL
ncbi:hypothetical protein E2C01_045799 [Portunus trituberculatus]|uniref:Uncharacterized protein n=1 Tax=Portunus trituberculatus TaxID=210409 RepID=A0A5B7FWQ9_PORTR|nr:hypothetical protein [Portunus trituberculatus]